MQLKPAVEEPDNFEFSNCGKSTSSFLTSILIAKRPFVDVFPAIGINLEYFYYFIFICHHTMENIKYDNMVPNM